MRHLILGIFLWVCGLMPAAAMAQTSFAPGQVWTLADPAFAQTEVVIDKVETWNNQPIVHITVTHVPVPAASGAPQPFTTIAHMPFSQDALRASVGTLVQADGQPFAGFESGYQQWQEAHGGVFTVPVGQALKAILGILPAATPSTSYGEKASGTSN